MKNKKNLLIVVLLLVGTIGYGLVEGYIIPQMVQKEETYQEDQNDPETHDFENVLKYKSKYMGNASNIINLNYHLPFNHLDKTYQLYPDELTVDINIKAEVSQVEPKLLEQVLFYNSTAHFVLIDNLEVLNFNFGNTTYTLAREQVEEWFGVSLASLQDPDIWKKEVQDQLADRAYVEQFIKENVMLRLIYSVEGSREV